MARRTPAPVLAGDSSAALAAVDRLAALTKERDALEGAAMHHEQRADQAEKELLQVAAERDTAVVERDGLASRALPVLGDPEYPENPETKDPIGAVIHDQMVAQYGGYDS